MVGIENDEDKELDGARFSPEAFSDLFENILLTLSNLNTADDPANQPLNLRNHTTGINRQINASELDESSHQSPRDGEMTILPKKKSHKERSDQRDNRHHERVHGLPVGASASQASYSRSDFNQDPARGPHPDINSGFSTGHNTNSRLPNPSSVTNESMLHSHRHSNAFSQQQHHSESIGHANISGSDVPYHSQLGIAFSEVSSADSYMPGSSVSCDRRHDRSLLARKDRGSNHYDSDSNCHAKKRCLSPGFSESSYSSTGKCKQSTKSKCAAPSKASHQRISTPLPSASSLPDETANSDDNNSEDEYYGNITRKTLEDEEKFGKIIEKKGWCIKQMASDGACLFRAVADQVYGDQEMHDEVRKNCLDYMSKNADHFSPYVTEDFSKYISRKRNISCHGNHLEIQALSEVYNRPIEIYYYDIEPRNVFHGDYKTDYPPIRLSYHGNVHYNSIREPYSATVGIGLGLPGYQPGLAEKQLIAEAVKRSEDCEIEETMLKDKMKDSDWDVMQAQIEDQIAQESYQDWLMANRGGKRSPKSMNSPTAHHQMQQEQKQKQKQKQQQQQQIEQQRLKEQQELQQQQQQQRSSPTATGALAAAAAAAASGGEAPKLGDFLPAEMSHWDENAILAHALAQSTLQYYDSLRCARSCDRPGCSKDS